MASASDTPSRSNSRRGASNGHSSTHQHHTQPSSSRIKSSSHPPSPSRRLSTTSSHSHHRAQPDPEHLRGADTAGRGSRRNSVTKDRPAPGRVEQGKGAASSTHAHHHRRHSKGVRSDEMSTTVNGNGPAPAPAPVEQSQQQPPSQPQQQPRISASRSTRSRTTIPTNTGSWVLGKTIGQGSMGKVKLARKLEGGEQVFFFQRPFTDCETDLHRSLSRLFQEDPLTTNRIRAEQIGRERITRRRFAPREKPLL